MRKKASKPSNLIQTFVADIKSVSQSPRFQIIVAHAVIELLVYTLAELKCKNPKSKQFSYARQLVILHEKGIIGDSQNKFLEAFYTLRNVAAHETQFNLTSKMLIPFKGLVAYDKKSELDNPNNFAVLCSEMVLRFWITYNEDFYGVLDEVSVFDIVGDGLI